VSLRAHPEERGPTFLLGYRELNDVITKGDCPLLRTDNALETLSLEPNGSPTWEDGSLAGSVTP
jgi:hypothetical protein